MERINRIINNPAFKLYLRYNRELEQKRIFCTHDFDHLLAVARLTYLLLLELGAQPIIKESAYAAALLHDIGRWREHTENIDHALAGAELARPILEISGFKLSEIEPVLSAIREHRHNIRPGVERDLLSRSLYNADQFSRLCFKCKTTDSCWKYRDMPHNANLQY